MVCLPFPICGLLVWLIAFMPVTPVYPDSTDSQSHARIQQKVDDLFAKRRQLVKETLVLPAEVASQFWPVYDQYEVELSDVRAKRRELLADLGRNFDGMSEAEAKTYVLNKLALEERRNLLTRKYFDRLATFMSYKSLATYIQLETKIRVFIEAGIEESIPLIR